MLRDSLQEYLKSHLPLLRSNQAFPYFHNSIHLSTGTTNTLFHWPILNFAKSFLELAAFASIIFAPIDIPALTN